MIQKKFIKKIQFSIIEIKIEIKTTTTAVIKNELKHFAMSEGNIFQIKELENTGVASRAEYTHDVMKKKKYVRFTTSSCLGSIGKKLSSLLADFGRYGQKQPLQIFRKIGVLKNFANVHRKTSVLKSPFNKVKAYTLLKRDSSTCVFL